MSKIPRKTALIFAENAVSTDIEQFGSMAVSGSPNYTVDPAVIQALAAWGLGWTAALVGPNNTEFKQDRNAVDYVASYQLAYILQQGVAEWDSGTTYYTGSIVQYSGNIYQSLVDTNLNNTPTGVSSAYWKSLSTQPTQTILSAGTSGTYTPPANVLFIRFKMIGGGGGSAGSGGSGGNGYNTNLGPNYTCDGGSGGTSAAGGGGGGGSFPSGTFNIFGAPGFLIGGAPGFGGSNIFGLSGYGAGATANDGLGGGGAGGYLEGQILNPSAMSYSVGAGGSAGAAGTGYVGYVGNGGIIVIEEYYY